MRGDGVEFAPFNCRDLLVSFRKATGQKPQRIIFYRSVNLVASAGSSILSDILSCQKLLLEWSHRQIVSGIAISMCLVIIRTGIAIRKDLTVAYLGCMKESLPSCCLRNDMVTYSE